MRKKLSTAAAEEVGGSLDLLWEILILLPLKSLIRSKCVSRQWLTLISDQQFRESHRDKHQRYNTSLIFNPKASGRIEIPHILCFTATTPTPPPTRFNLNFLHQYELNVVRSCNGIILCHGLDPFNYFICNPITREFTSLTLPSWFKSKPPRNRSLFLAFNPFQIISVAAVNASKLDWVFNVYSFKSRSWIHSQSEILRSTPSEIDDVGHGVYCNRAIHWCNRGYFFIYFDLDTKCLQNLPIPPAYSEFYDRCLHYFGESGGRLHMMLSPRLGFNFNYDIYELKEDYSEWTWRHHLDLNSLHSEIVLDIIWSRYQLPLGLYIVRTAKNHLSVLIAGKYGAMVYDPVDGTSRKLCDFRFGSTSLFYTQNSIQQGEVLQYFENNERFVELARVTNQN